jgi:replicative DNA helicase
MDMSKKEVTPFNAENEMVVLSAMIRNEELRTRLSKELTADKFIAGRNRAVFRTLVEMEEEGLAFDLDTFSQVAGDREFGGLKYVKSLVKLFDGGKNIEYHLKVLREDRVKMNLLRGPVADLMERLEDPTADLSTIMDVQRDITDVLATSVDRASVQSSEVVAGRYMVDITDRVEGRSSHFVPLDLEVLDDHVIEGQARKKISVVFGRPRMGKSTLVSSGVVKKLKRAMKKHRGDWEAIKNDKEFPRHLVCPLEMGSAGFLDSVVANMAGVSINKILKTPKNITKQEIKRIRSVMEIIRKTDMVHVLDKPGLRLKDMPSILSSREYGIVWFDLWEKMVLNKEQKEIASGLHMTQDFAKEFDTHICIVHQAQRKTSTRDGGRPTLEDLKNSGTYEEVADLVLGINRPFFSDEEQRRREKKNKKKGIDSPVDYMEVKILKQRKGPALKRWFKYEFDGEYNRIGDHIQSLTLSSPVVEVLEDDGQET